MNGEEQGWIERKRKMRKLKGATNQPNTNEEGKVEVRRIIHGFDFLFSLPVRYRGGGTNFRQITKMENNLKNWNI